MHVFNWLITVSFLMTTAVNPFTPYTKDYNIYSMNFPTHDRTISLESQAENVPRRRTHKILIRAIIPRRGRLEYNADEIDHHRHQHRPGFPAIDVSPEMIFKYPKTPDPLLEALPPDAPPAASLQPQIVLPPAPPPPGPIIINTGSGPAATIMQVTPQTPAPPAAAAKVPDPSVPNAAGNGDRPLTATTEGNGNTGEGGGSSIGGNAASYNGMGGPTSSDYKGSGPAQGGPTGLGGPYWSTEGSGSGIGERVEPYKTTPNKPVAWDGAGADWIGTINGGEGEVPNSNANVGKGGSNGSDEEKGGDQGAGADGKPASDDSNEGGNGKKKKGNKAYSSDADNESVSTGFEEYVDDEKGKCCKGGGALYVEPKIIDTFGKMYEKFVTLQKDIRKAEKTEGGVPTQIAKGLLASEMYRLEDIIENLNKKIDVIGKHVAKRPSLLGRAALMAGMTSTFGDLQNTIETLNEKLDQTLKQPTQGQLLVTPTSQGQQSQEDRGKEMLAKALEKLGAAGWLGVNGPAIGFQNYELAAKAAHLEGLKMANLKSNERLEDTMHLLADRLMGLEEHTDHIPNGEVIGFAPGKVDPLVRQEQDKLMSQQAAIMSQMAFIQGGLDRLAKAVVKLNQPPPTPPPVDRKIIGMVQKVLKSAADAFKGIAKQTADSSTNLGKTMEQTVKNAEQFVKSKEIQNLSYPLITGVKGEANILNSGAMLAGLGNGVSGLASSMGATTTGMAAAGNPFVGSPFGLQGANEAVPQESIPQLAASIANIPVGGLDSSPIPKIPFVASAATRPFDLNPFNYGTYGNGRPQLGVVTGNLGGSLGLGGIGGIDGGNALIMNRTLSSKKEEICQDDIFTCITRKSKRGFTTPERFLKDNGKRNLKHRPRFWKLEKDFPNRRNSNYEGKRSRAVTSESIHKKNLLRYVNRFQLINSRQDNKEQLQKRLFRRRDSKQVIWRL